MKFLVRSFKNKPGVWFQWHQIAESQFLKKNSLLKLNKNSPSVFNDYHFKIISFLIIK